MAGITEAANGEKSQIDFKEITSFIVEDLSKYGVSFIQI